MKRVTRPLLCLALLTSTAINCGRARDEESVPLLSLHRPMHVGLTATEEATGEIEIRGSVYRNGEIVSEDHRRAKIRLKHEFEVTEVDANGRPYRIKYTVREVEGLDGTSIPSSFKPGSVVDAIDTARGDIQSGLPSAGAPEVIQLLGIMMSPEQRDLPTIDEKLDLPAPRTLGDTWPVNSESFRNVPPGGNFSMKNADISGEAYWSELREVGGDECYIVNLTTEFKSMEGPIPEGFSTEESSMVFDDTAAVSVDPSIGIKSSESTAFLNLRLKGNDGTILTRSLYYEIRSSLDYRN